MNRPHEGGDGSAGDDSSAEQPHLDEHARDPLSGVLRASIFGVSDGLVSNLALVAGVAGGSGDPDAVVLAGIAGLLAGAFSMAAGEYVSMQTQRELLERELELEREHILKYPVEEEAHLARMLAENGLDEAEAQRIAARVHLQIEPALDFHARFELGIHSRSLGAPGPAAWGSFASFTAGAAVPLVPWFFLESALLASALLSGAALLAVGAAATRLTRRRAWLGASRQLAFGAVAAGITFAVGWLVGVGVS